MAGLNETTSGNRIHIAFFGRRNAGKSTLVNALTGQEIAIVSDVAGTTTDPVSKAMEILPLGPCLITDTAGLDDEGPLGEERVRRSLEVLEKTDVAVWVEADGPDDAEGRFRAACAARNIPILVYRRGDSVEGLKRRIAEIQLVDAPRPLIADLVRPGDTVVCVCPIDESAPKGRLILPQQQIVRELLDAGAAALVCQPEMLGKVLATCPPPPLRHHRQPGVRRGVEGCAEGGSAHELFNRLRAGEGRSRGVLRGGRGDEEPAGRRRGAGRRRVYAPPPVQRHRHGEAAALGRTVRGGAADIRVLFGERLPGQPFPLRARDPVRRVHAHAAGGAGAHRAVPDGGRADHELRHRHCRVPRHPRLARELHGDAVARWTRNLISRTPGRWSAGIQDFCTIRLYLPWGECRIFFHR